MEFWPRVRILVARALRQPLLAYIACVVWFDQCHDAVDAKIMRRASIFESGLSTDPRIVGGTPAAAGDYPFYVNTIQPILCGGTLIYEDIILTAAHCAGGFLAGVNVGGTMLDGTDAVETLSVDSEFLHPNYDQGTRVNDIMLVKLTDPASSPVVQLNFDPAVPATDELVTVIGFGDVQDGGDPSMVLLMVDVNVYTDQFCDDLYNVYEPDTMLCAGTPGGGRDSCQGDSGGPLLTSTNVQIGIVSTGSGCGLPDVPAIYTEVSAFQSFIRQGICDLSDNPPPDCGPTSAPAPAGTPVVAPTEAPVGVPTTSAPTVTPVAGPTTSLPTASPVVTSSPVVAPVSGPAEAPVPGATATPTVTVEPTASGSATSAPSLASEPTAAPIPITDSPTVLLDSFEPTLKTRPPFLDLINGDERSGKMKMGSKSGMMMGKKSHKGGMMMGEKGGHGKGGKGSYGKGIKFTSKGNFIMALHALHVSNSDTGLDTAIDLVTGSP